jgi:hypothetical protein
MNPVAYKLDLPASLKIHPVFHASLLKAYEPGRVSPPPPPDVVDGEYEWEVEAILAHKDVQVWRKNLLSKTYEVHPARPWWAMPLLFGEIVHVTYSPKKRAGSIHLSSGASIWSSGLVRMKLTTLGSQRNIAKTALS